MTVTLKAGRDYDAPWIVVRGTGGAVEDELGALSGWAREAWSDENLTPIDRVLAVAESLKAKYQVGVQLGGRPVGDKGVVADYGLRPQDVETEPVPSVVQSEIDGLSDNERGLLKMILDCEDVKALQGLWKSHSTMFANSVLLTEKFKEQGRLLTRLAKGNQ